MRYLGLALLLALPATASESTDLAQAIQLPARADGLRDAGVAKGDVEKALHAARDKGLPADEAEMIFDEAEKQAKEKGPVDNFGAFVQERLDEGLRGKELAQAIREEHARQGKGKGPDGEKGGKGKAPGHGDDDGEKGGKGKAPDHGDEKGGKGKSPDAGDDKGKGGKSGKGKAK